MSGKKALAILIITLLTAGLTTATATAHGTETESVPQAAADYDLNSNGMIDRPEAIQAVRDYFGGYILRSDAITVIRYYLSGESVGYNWEKHERTALETLFEATGGREWSRNG